MKMLLYQTRMIVVVGLLHLVVTVCPKKGEGALLIKSLSAHFVKYYDKVTI